MRKNFGMTFRLATIHLW